VAGASGAGAPQAVKSIAATTSKASVCQIAFFILLSLGKGKRFTELWGKMGGLFCRAPPQHVLKIGKGSGGLKVLS
jgi:hypothetical protein